MIPDRILFIKQKINKFCVIIVLIIASILLFGCCFNVLLCAALREHNAVDINEENIEYIEEQVKKYVDDEDDMPDIRAAERISCLVLMHKDEINIEYGDGTTYRFFIRGAIISDLRKYIMTDGYNCYIHSAEFFEDSVPLAVSGAVVILCGVYLRRNRRKTKRNEEIINGI